jgi:calcineurin-like phosphoesterase family protein
MEERNAALIRNRNKTVGSQDEVWPVGDVMAAKAGSCNELLRKLNGGKHLIVGNNDPESTSGFDAQWLR